MSSRGNLRLVGGHGPTQPRLRWWQKGLYGLAIAACAVLAYLAVVGLAVILGLVSKHLPELTADLLALFTPLALIFWVVWAIYYLVRHTER